jgi:hypothetical protein
MNRIQVACYCLMASAFVLAGLLVAAVSGGGFTPRAEAGLVVSHTNFTVMTARTRVDEEALFVLENTSGKLLIYSVDVAHNRIALNFPPVDLGQLFTQALGPTAPPAGGGGSTPGGGRTPR